MPLIHVKLEGGYEALIDSGSVHSLQFAYAGCIRVGCGHNDFYIQGTLLEVAEMLGLEVLSPEDVRARTERGFIE